MRRFTLASFMAAFLLAVVVLATDGPLTPLMQLRGRTDGNGYLLVSGGTYSGADGPLTPLGNLRGRTDQNGYVRVALAGGTFTGQLLAPDGTVAAPSYSFTNATGSGLYSLSAGRPALAVNGTQGLFLDGTGALVASSALKFDATSTDIVLVRNGAAGRLAAYGGSASVGLELAIGSAQPTLTACGTGTLTAKSTNIAGEVTATGATACTINFGAPVWSNQPFCVVEEETSAVAQRISAISTTAFTVTGLTSGDKFMYQCLGGK